MSGLGLQTGGDAANRIPIIKYDARAGRIFRVDRSNESGSWENTPVEITDKFMAIMDLENIETGWLSFPSGSAPDIRTAKIGAPLPERPSDKHRQGFRVLMKLGKTVGGDVREMAANAAVSIHGMDELYDAYRAQAAEHPGQLPIVTLAGTTAISSTGKDETGRKVTSTNYQPIWAIKDWCPRPAELTASGEPPEGDKPPVGDPPADAPPSQPEPAPAPAPAAAKAADRELVTAEEF